MINYAWIPVAAIILVVTAIVVSNAVRAKPCSFGRHKRKYVAIRDLNHCGHQISWGRLCTFQSCLYRHQHHIQDARWVCAATACKAIGEHCIDDRGIWAVHQGELVLDEKRITQWQDNSDFS